MAPLDTADLTASDVLATIGLYRCLGVAIPSSTVREQGDRYAVGDDPDTAMRPFGSTARLRGDERWPRRRV